MTLATLFPQTWSRVRLLHSAFGAYYPQLSLIVVCAVFGALFEAVGISAVVPMFSFLGGSAGAASDIISGAIQSLFSFLHIPYSFRYLLLFVAVLFVARTVAMFLIQYTTARIVMGYERDMREKLFAQLVRSDWLYFSAQKSGAVSHVIMNNATSAAQFFNFLALVVVIGMKTLAYTIIAINVSPTMALLALLAGPVIFFMLRPVHARSHAYSVRHEKGSRDIGHFVNQYLGGMKTLKAMGVEKNVIADSARYFDSVRSYSVGILTLRGVVQAIVHMVALIFIGAAFAIAYRMPDFTFATFLVAVFAVNQIFSQLQLAQTQLNSLIAMFPYLASLLSHIDDAKKHAEEESPHGQVDFKDAIIFKDVSFSYPGRSGQVLSNVSFSVPRGAMLGIIGPSGAGKTTIADILLRMYEPHQGVVTVDGKNLNEFSLHAWRTSLGYVTQDAFLIHDTILSNIVFYGDASREDVVEAAKLVDIHDFIETLPHKYDTVVGDRGVLLSGGQRQRIVLARILARKPKLLILDEATSALDGESERAIHAAIEKLRGKTTIIVIAHRLSTVRDADNLIVLEEGHVKEEGSPDKLLKDKDSYFFRVYSAS